MEHAGETTAFERSAKPAPHAFTAASLPNHEIKAEMPAICSFSMMVLFVVESSWSYMCRTH